jgi:Ca2+-transporting ATPase
VIGRLMTGLPLTDTLNHPEADAGTTMAFGVLAISQLFHAFNVKSSRTLFGRNLISNKALIGAFGAGLALQLGVMLIPPVREIFKLVALTGTQWVIVFGLALCPVVIMELAKLIQRLMKRK